MTGYENLYHGLYAIASSFAVNWIKIEANDMLLSIFTISTV